MIEPAGMPVTAAVTLRPDGEWRRLSPRMLLIHPVREVGRFIPALFGILVAGRNSGNDWWSLIALAAVVLLSLVRWFSTRYRITPSQVQLRTGLVRRRTITAPADRVRSVDVTAHALHRVLGLARVVIGTGTSDRKKEALSLDGLTAPAAAALRAELLHRTPVAGSAGVVPAWGGPPAEQLVARLDPAWIRYAPFTLSGAITGLAIIGLGWRVLSQADVHADRAGAVHRAARHLRETPLWLDVVQLAVGALAVVTVLSIVGYGLAFWNFTLTRHQGGTLHVSRGLITARATSIEERRLRGVELLQLLPLRLVGGARLLAVATGLRVGRGAERGGELLMPACPVEVAVGVAGVVLADPQLPMRAPLRRHGPVARRRRFVRALVPAGLVWLALLLLAGPGPLPVGWAVAGLAVPAGAIALANDRYRGLGHALAGRYLISQSGSLHRRRVILETDGVIGWNLRQTFFQRRAGLLTLTATTAAGRQSYQIVDLDPAEALLLAQQARPGLLEQFLMNGEATP